MNYATIIYTLGYLLQFEGVFLLAPFAVAVYYDNDEKWMLLGVAAAAALVGTILRLLTRKRRKGKGIHAKEGFIITALSWIIMSAVGAIPFVLSGWIPSFTDAMFEVVSGFTTTGASILTNIEALPRSLLFWRSFTHWIAGMGVLVFMLAVIPSSADEMNIMRAESPGPVVDKLVPKVRQSAFILYAIYAGMTVAEIVILILEGMPTFDSFCLSFGTAGTGGFGIKADSIASYSPLCQNTITIAMFLFGVNFKAYYLILMRKFKGLLKCEEIFWYFIIYAGAVAIICFDMANDIGSIGLTIRQATFQVSSVMTTTGYATTEFNNWHTLSKAIMVGAMFVGACAGSTGGGIKVSRIVLYFKQVHREMFKFVHPRSVKNVRLDGDKVDEETLRQANVYLMAYFFIFAVSFLLVCLDGFDLISSFTAIVATINNIGPGLEMVGPTGSFVAFSILSKWVLILDMLIGRLEIFPILILFHLGTWRKK